MPKLLLTYLFAVMVYIPVTYLKLEDITSRFTEPCIIDVKMGCVTYSLDADPEKKLREQMKYPPAAQLGFQFVGMRVRMVPKCLL